MSDCYAGYNGGFTDIGIRYAKVRSSICLVALLATKVLFQILFVQAVTVNDFKTIKHSLLTLFRTG